MTDPTDRPTAAFSPAKAFLLLTAALGCLALLVVQLVRSDTGSGAATHRALGGSRPAKRVRVQVSGLPAGSRFGLLSRTRGEGLRLQVARLPEDLVAAIPRTGEIIAGISSDGSLAPAETHHGVGADLSIRFADRGSVLLRAESGALDAAGLSLAAPSTESLDRRDVEGLRALWSALQKGGIGSATIVCARRGMQDSTLPTELLCTQPSWLGPLFASFAAPRPQRLNDGDVTWPSLPPGRYRFTIPSSAGQTFNMSSTSDTVSVDRSLCEVTIDLAEGEGVVVPIREVADVTIRGSVASLRPFESCGVTLLRNLRVVATDDREERLLSVPPPQQRNVVDSNDFQFSGLDQGVYLVKAEARLGENHYAVAEQWVDVTADGGVVVAFDGERGRRLQVDFEPELGDVSLTPELRSPALTFDLYRSGDGQGWYVPYALPWRTADGPLVVEGLKASGYSVFCSATDLLGPEGRSVYTGYLNQVISTEDDVRLSFAPQARELLEVPRAAPDPSGR